MEVKMDADRELLRKVAIAIDRTDLFRSILLRDSFDDWDLARELGEFLVRIGDEAETMGHALLVRAHRHLGDRDLAVSELSQCQSRIAGRPLKAWEQELLLPMLLEEEALLGKPGGHGV